MGSNPDRVVTINFDAGFIAILANEVAFQINTVAILYLPVSHFALMRTIEFTKYFDETSFPLLRLRDHLE